MDVRLEERDDRPELTLSELGDWELFDDVAAALLEHFGGEWTTQADGPDQRYWDLVVGEAAVTLHLEHVLGVSLFPASDAAHPDASKALLRDIAKFLRRYQRPR